MTAATALQNRIDRMFGEKRAQNRAASVFYVTAGFPDLKATEDIVDALVEGGADLIEIGIPFSDPVADGPTIQKASLVSLQGGTKVHHVIELVGRIRARHDISVILFSAFNPILHYGPEKFMRDIAAAGADGVLIPDLPPEEAETVAPLAAANGLKMIFLVAPTTTTERMKLIADQSSGFIYYISLRGVTGARAALPEDMKDNLARLKSLTDLPVVVGFGVARPEHAAQVAACADGAVVGSALINLIEAHAGKPELKSEVTAFARSIAGALKKS